LVNALLNNGLPVDAETLQRATFFRYSEGDLSLDEILFLLKEEFVANKSSIETLGNIKNGTLGMNNSINNMIHTLFDDAGIPSNLQKELLSVLLGGEDSNTEIKKLLGDAFDKHDGKAMDKLKDLVDDKLYMTLQNKDSLKNMDSYFKIMHDSTESLGEILEKNLPKSALGKEVMNIRDNIEFMNNVKNFKEFMQVPFMINDSKNQGDLYVFKDGKKKTNLADKADILLALDYEHLGHIEIYINKAKNILNFQFKSPDNSVLKTIGENFSRLSNMMTAEGYNISGLALRRLDEKFDVTKDMSDKTKVNQEKKRFSFDMRV